MKKYYYVETYLDGYEEIIILKDDPELTIVPHLLVWLNRNDRPVEENILIQITHRKVMGKWQEVNYTYTYLMDHHVILEEELVKHDSIGCKYPPGFHMK